MKVFEFLSSNFSAKLGSITVSAQTIRVIAIIFLIFLLILTLAQIRRHFVGWSLKGAGMGLFFGFLFTMILEGFLIIGGRTAITEFLGWKNAPKPIQNVVDMGRNKLTEVLGIKETIPVLNAGEIGGYDEAVNLLQNLSPADIGKVKSLICTP